MCNARGHKIVCPGRWSGRNSMPLRIGKCLCSPIPPTHPGRLHGVCPRDRLGAVHSLCGRKVPDSSFFFSTGRGAVQGFKRRVPPTPGGWGWGRVGVLQHTHQGIYPYGRKSRNQLHRVVPVCSLPTSSFLPCPARQQTHPPVLPVPSFPPPPMSGCQMKMALSVQPRS